MVVEAPKPLTAVGVLRRDPGLAPVFTASRLCARTGPLAAQTVARLRADRPEDTDDQLINRFRDNAVVRVVGLGAICGTSMYVAIVPAMGDVYCIQLLLTLQIGAVLGHDPQSPDRVADVLVARGNARDLAHARRLIAEASRLPPRKKSGEPLLQRIRALVTSTPTLIGNRVRGMSLWDKIRVILMLVGLLFPLVSIPLWAVQYRTATSAVAKRAQTLFAGPREADTALPPGQKLPLAEGRVRILLGVVVVLAVIGLIGFTIFTAETSPRLRFGGVFYLVANVVLALLISWRLRRFR